jgi:hypothetical protein
MIISYLTNKENKNLSNQYIYINNLNRYHWQYLTMMIIISVVNLSISWLSSNLQRYLSITIKQLTNSFFYKWLCRFTCFNLVSMTGTDDWYLARTLFCCIWLTGCSLYRQSITVRSFWLIMIMHRFRLIIISIKNWWKRDLYYDLGLNYIYLKHQWNHTFWRNTFILINIFYQHWFFSIDQIKTPLIF